MKIFQMYRKNDETGVSGTGLVVEGIIFSDNKIAARWTSSLSSINIYNCWNDFEKIHILSHPTNGTYIIFSPEINNLQHTFEETYTDNIKY